MSKFFNTSRGSVSATIGDKVAVFPAKQWTSLADDIELSPSLKSLLDQRVLIPGVVAKPLLQAQASKPRVPAKSPPKPIVKADPKTKEDRLSEKHSEKNSEKPSEKMSPEKTSSEKK